MRHKIVLTSNIVKFLSALDALRNRGVGEEGMGLLSGRPGEGKTTTISYVVNTHGGIYLRARATWTITRLLRAILQELKLEPSHYRDPMVDQAIASLSEMPRPIFVDEADYLFRKTEMLDVLRDIYDAAKVPVVLVGMEDIAKKIRSQERYSRFHRRITQWLDFAGLSYEDTANVARELCEVEIREDLVRRLHTETKGNIGAAVVGIGKLERYAFTNSLPSVGAKEYGNRPLS